VKPRSLANSVKERTRGLKRRLEADAPEKVKKNCYQAAARSFFFPVSLLCMLFEVTLPLLATQEVINHVSRAKTSRTNGMSVFAVDAFNREYYSCREPIRQTKYLI
jgi:hypothetical protein